MKIFATNQKASKDFLTGGMASGAKTGDAIADARIQAQHFGPEIEEFLFKRAWRKGLRTALRHSARVE
jgi:hypothetical protein